MAVFDVDGATACELCSKSMVDIVSSFAYRGKKVRIGLCWACHRDSEHKIKQAIENQRSNQSARLSDEE